MSSDGLHITMTKERAKRLLQEVPPQFRGLVLESGSYFGPVVKCPWCSAEITDADAMPLDTMPLF